jgi:hypothetical protein
VERALLYLALVAAVALVMSTALLTSRPHPLRATCSDVRTLARDILTASASRGAVQGTYRFDYPVVIAPSGVYCQECLVELSIPTQNSTVLIGRQRLVIDASNGIVKLYKLKF